MISPLALPYTYDALEPMLSADQVEYHYERLYKRYVRRTNEMTDGRWTRPEEAVNEAVSRGDDRLFNQAAQAWSHQVYFASMIPGAQRPSPSQLRLLGPGFMDRWVAASESVFGSGWVWLTGDPGERPQIQTTKDAGLPRSPVILVMDVWEHAYYCDYPGRRADYARAWVERLADWSQLERGVA